MFKKLFKFIREIRVAMNAYDSLDSYIEAGNPQSAADVERLEREYSRLRRPFMFERYY